LRGRRAIRLVAALAIVAILGAPSPAQADALEESSVKAAILFNVARFTEWPPTSFANETAPVVLCVVGADPAGALERLDGKTLKGRPLRVRQAGEPRLRECHIAYIGPEHANLAEVLKTAEQLTVLTVSDIDRFARKGGMIGLVNEGGKIRFEINLKAAERAGLKLSSQLLKLASVVRN
jgi:hypothetical protein